MHDKRDGDLWWLDQADHHLFELAFAIAAQYESLGRGQPATKYYLDALEHLNDFSDGALRVRNRIVTLDRIAQCYDDRYALCDENGTVDPTIDISYTVDRSRRPRSTTGFLSPRTTSTEGNARCRPVRRTLPRSPSFAPSNVRFQRCFTTTDIICWANSAGQRPSACCSAHLVLAELQAYQMKSWR